MCANHNYFTNKNYISRLEIWVPWSAFQLRLGCQLPMPTLPTIFVFWPEKAGVKENNLPLLYLLLSCGFNDTNLLLQGRKATGKRVAGAVIYITSCSSSLSEEENHPEEQWLSLRQQLMWIYEPVADIINLFSFPNAGSEALLWEQTFCTLQQNRSCFLGDSAPWEP